MRTVSVTGTYLDAAGTPAVGSVAFCPIETLGHDSPSSIRMAAPIRVTLDSEGTVTVVLMASNDPDWNSGPVPYRITESLVGQPPRIYLAMLDEPGPVDLANVQPLPGWQFRIPSSSDVDLSGYLTEAEAAAIYAPLHSPTLTGIVGVPTLPGNTAGDLAASVDYVNEQVIAAVKAAAANTGTRRFHLQNPATLPVDPGELGIGTLTGQQRRFTISKVDADGHAYNLALMLPGDTITITDDPATPPITGFARYVVTSDPIEQANWWELNATRTDTAGSQTPPADGTMVRFIPTLAGGIQA